MSFVDEREDDEETQQALDSLWRTMCVSDHIRMRAAIRTHEGSWAEETAGAFVDVGVVVGGPVVRE